MPRSLLVSATLIAALLGPAVISVPSISRVAMAQNGILAELYGSGVHAYYSNDLPKAFDLLSRAIDGGLDDPRAYYFRGLTNIASGRPSEAEADFRAGAEIEALGAFGTAIGRSLTRVQGSQRMQIEQIRQQARLEKKSEATARAQRRYSEVQQADAQVLRQLPQPRSAPPIPGRRPAPTVPLDAPDPFDNDSMASGEPTVQSPDALGDPFLDEAPATAAPPRSDAAAPAASPFDAAPGADPFNTAPADIDPFGESPF